MIETFNDCVYILESIAYILGITYEEINVWGILHYLANPNNMVSLHGFWQEDKKKDYFLGLPVFSSKYILP